MKLVIYFVIFSVFLVPIISFMYSTSKNNIQLLYFSSKLHSVPQWLESSSNNIDEELPEITIRFINTIDGKDVITKAAIGSNLLAVGDKNGVKLPRACRTGLCGSCTCEVKDFNAIVTSTNPREGFATIRACSTKCFLPEGMQEMIVDVHRLQKKKNKKSIETTSNNYLVDSAEEDDDLFTDPMSRFGENWESEFKPQWELNKMDNSLGIKDPKKQSMICSNCSGSSRAICYNCLGRGIDLMEQQCGICVGLKTVGCGYCRGTGYRMR